MTATQVLSTRKKLIRMEVLNKAAELFVTKGFDATSKQDIADAVGLQRTSLYYYFKSKEEVLAALVEDVSMLSAEKLMKTATRADLSSDEKLRKMVEIAIEHIMDHHLNFRVLERNENALPEPFATNHVKAKKKIVSAYISVLQDGVRCGIFRPLDERVTAFSIIGMVNWLAWWFSPEKGASKADTVKTLIDLALRSVISDKAPHATDTADSIISELKLNIGQLEKVIKQSNK